MKVKITVVSLLFCCNTLSFSQDIEQKKFAHSALLYIVCYNKAKSVGCVCGSSILNHLLLLSAGHCFEDCFSDTKVLATVGHVSISDGIPHLVSSYKVHEEYDRDTVANDIAVLKLKTPLSLGDNVNRVSILRNPPMDQLAILALWGPIDETSGFHTGGVKFLKNIKIMRDNDCLKVVQVLPKTSFCARIKGDDGDYLAEGDSGSALLVRGYIQIGLVSFKDPDVASSITIYTDVSKLYDWINKQSKQILCSV